MFIDLMLRWRDILEVWGDVCQFVGCQLFMGQTTYLTFDDTIMTARKHSIDVCQVGMWHSNMLQNNFVKTK